MRLYTDWQPTACDDSTTEPSGPRWRPNSERTPGPGNGRQCFWTTLTTCRTSKHYGRRSDILPTPANLKLRLALIAKFDQLSARLENGDESAVEEAHDHIGGLLLSDDTGTLALVMQAFARVLESFQGEVDSESWRYTIQ